MKATLAIVALSTLAMVANADVGTYLCCRANALRASHNLPVLKWSNELHKIATAHSNEQSQYKQMTHNGFTSQTASLSDRLNNFCSWSFQYAEENIAAGFPTPNDVADAWEHSPEHFENIVNNRITVCGAGVSNDGQYFTQNFALPASNANEVFVELDCSNLNQVSKVPIPRADDITTTTTSSYQSVIASVPSSPAPTVTYQTGGSVNPSPSSTPITSSPGGKKCPKKRCSKCKRNASKRRRALAF
ncbi:hypothetical protein EV182_003823 [Spiromyces aspiralis]|uniref:Uncharacterized protein n=1 Tax=Spiromyces aspiralis TaxID=68401 RepID=A0ACC1HGD9_9FUNG|nr:hypothetical protein EV182_003823 [Spiromyces aspiralis]